MNNDKRSGYFTREGIMDLLSDDEIARVTTAESARSLAEGEEYVDLEQLDQGVQTATRGAVSLPMGRVVSKGAVQERTWTNIVEHLKSRRIAPAQAGT